MISIMSDEFVALLSAMSGRERSLAAGDFLFHRGDAVTSVFVVLGGRIDLLRYQEDGSAIILQRAGPRDFLAEASLFSDRYHCDALAQTQAAVAAVPKEALRDRLRREPEFSEGLASHLAHGIQNARFRSEVLALRTVAARLAAWQGWYGNLPPKGEWSQLADQIGVSPEALYREMAKRRRTRGFTN